jgi:multiple sugar transport system ATP-binding protein
MAHVELKNIHKIYPEKHGSGHTVVHGIDLEVRDGEFMVLVGPSGCGKSTTLRMIAGLEDISAGTIAIDGRVINEISPKDRDIAMVFQNYALYPHMSVYENMAFGLRLRRMGKSGIDARVREAAGMLQIEHLLDRKPKALSGGQRQRVAVGRAIVRKPKVFLFDEPLSNLDAKMRVSTRAEISRLHARLGVTMIYVTHDQIEAMTMGDRICVMNEGRIVQVAEPLALYNAPVNMFIAGFIGSPPMNFFHGFIRGGGDGLEFVEDNATRVPFRIALSGPLARKARAQLDKPTVLGIRPEDVSGLVTPGGEDTRAGVFAVVELSELMGAEIFVHLHTGAHRFIARVEPTNHFATGATVCATFSLAKAHLFEAEKGAVLT